MQEEILQLYEKIEDQISQEAFLAEMEEVRESFGIDFINDVDCAREVLKNHGIDVNQELSKEESTSTMSDEIRSIYEEVKDKVSEDEFLKRMEYFRKENEDISFYADVDFAKMVKGEYIDEEVETVSEQPEYSTNTISELEKGSRDVTISGRVVSISNPRSFKTRKGASGEVCNV